MTYKEQLGQELKIARTRANMTQEEASRRSGVTRATISDYERGQCEPTLSTILVLAETYGMDDYREIFPALKKSRR